MPTRNSRKEYAPDTYYHVYSRGLNKQPIFFDEQDFSVFLGYLKRYLSYEASKRPNRKPVRSFASDIDLLSYCLMRNHVHLLFYQHEDERALSALLQRVFTVYSMYFNKKYTRVGPVFQSRYLASRIDNDPYLHHISRYIHRNPKIWSEYEFSSLRYYTGEAYADWVKPRAILELFDNNPRKYIEFVASMDEDDEETIVDFMAHE
ncbi:MAG TPA: transposase [Candidatus Saccharibacteria bacterium]|jgi:REP element-mobilizing transposase RayT|nr:transposase [Candidatus Saccharibacteria bacterium]HMR38408.1 transposase [Candidatus Saccharibacteria bacterium]